MGRELQLDKLDPEKSEELCAALRTWTPVLYDLYRSMIDQGAPADLANGITQGFWENMLAASFAQPEFED